VAFKYLMPITQSTISKSEGAAQTDSRRTVRHSSLERTHFKGRLGRPFCFRQNPGAAGSLLCGLSEPRQTWVMQKHERLDRSGPRKPDPRDTKAKWLLLAICLYSA
jgi:hypothetical protein